MSTSPRPTDAELSILRVLWSKGPSTVREIADEMNRERHVGYTTVLKFMQIMTEKGLVLRDDSSRTHVYRPKLSEEKPSASSCRTCFTAPLAEAPKARDAGAGSQESVAPSWTRSRKSWTK